MTRLTTILLIMLLCSSLSAGEPAIAGLVDAGRMASILGDGWKRNPGMLIENEKDVEKLSGLEKSMAEAVLKMMKPQGVIACGDVSFSRTQPPLNTITVRVFKFSSPEKAHAFRKLKYESEKAQSLYRKVETKSAVIYDSLQMKKRIVFSGTIWIVCGHIQDDDQHLKILKECVKLNNIQPPAERDK